MNEEISHGVDVRSLIQSKYDEEVKQGLRFLMGVIICSMQKLI